MKLFQLLPRTEGFLDLLPLSGALSEYAAGYAAGIGADPAALLAVAATAAGEREITRLHIQSAGRVLTGRWQAAGAHGVRGAMAT